MKEKAVGPWVQCVLSILTIGLLSLAWGCGSQSSGNTSAESNGPATSVSSSKPTTAQISGSVDSVAVTENPTQTVAVRRPPDVRIVTAEKGRLVAGYAVDPAHTDVIYDTVLLIDGESDSSAATGATTLSASVSTANKEGTDLLQKGMPLAGRGHVFTFDLSSPAYAGNAKLKASGRVKVRAFRTDDPGAGATDSPLAEISALTILQSSTVSYAMDLTYSRVLGQDLKLHIAMPNDGADLHPAVIFVHGGGWMLGTPLIYLPFMSEYAKRGYVAVAISYRFAPAYLWPSQIEDVKCAVRWLRANAQKYKVDPNRIGANGASAGGHLVALLATTNKSDGLEGNQGYEDQSSRIQAAVADYGAYDLLSGGSTPMLSMFETIFIGGTAELYPEKYKAASPATYVTKDDPPILLTHGTADPLVPIAQTNLFEQTLKQAGVPVEVLLLENAGHGFLGNDLVRASVAAIQFFDRWLKKGGGA